MRTQLETFMPRHGWRLVVQSIVPGPTAVVYRALQEVRPSEMTLAHWLAVLRTLGSRRAPAPEIEHTLLDTIRQVGWITLTDNPGHEVIMGLVGKVWRRDFGIRRMRDGDEFRDFAEPGYVKIAVSYRFEPEGAATCLVCETLVAATDHEAARRFHWYWRAIYAGAWLTVCSAMAAITRRVEHAYDTAA